MSELDEIRKQQLMLSLIDDGIVEFAGRFRRGFKFKIHQRYPRAPRAPMKFHLRTPEVTTYGGGRLNPKLLSEIAYQLWYEMVIWRSFCEGDWQAVAGIPYAGDPIAEAVVASALSFSGEKLQLVRMQKAGVGDKRHIVRVDPPEVPGTPLVLIDDLIAHGDSKREAIELSQQAGWQVAALLGLVDWELGGVEALRQSGVRTETVFGAREAVECWARYDRIPSWRYRRLQRYWGRNQRFFARLMSDLEADIPLIGN